MILTSRTANGIDDAQRIGWCDRASPGDVKVGPDEHQRLLVGPRDAGVRQTDLADRNTARSGGLQQWRGIGCVGAQAKPREAWPH